MKTKLYNQNAEVIGDIELPGSVFDAPPNDDLVHQVMRVLRANQRRLLAHTKGRGEVRGGGKKPWPQKGTGRARHGSTRSPIWKGGGVTHGPTKYRVFNLKINAKMRRKAIAVSLSEKARRESLRVVDSLSAPGGKTKHAAQVIDRFFGKGEGKRGSSVLVVLSSKDLESKRSYRNLEKVTVTEARNINVLDLINHRFVLMSQDAVPVLEKILSVT